MRGDEFVIVRGEGVWLFDADGNRYLDATASLWYCNVGHGRAEIADAVAAQMRDARGLRRSSATLADAARRSSSPSALAALVAARRQRSLLHQRRRRRDRHRRQARAPLLAACSASRSALHIISRTAAYHGDDGFGTSLGGIDANRAGFGPLVPSTVAGRTGTRPTRSSDEIEQVGAERVAAFFCEPVIGAGGVLPPPDGYVEAVAEICRDADVLFVVRLGHLRLRPARDAGSASSASASSPTWSRSPRA